MHAKKKEDKKELLRRQSSMWIDEDILEKRVLESIGAPQLFWGLWYLVSRI